MTEAMSKDAPFLTLVDLTFEKNRIEHWICFGRKSYEKILDPYRSIVGFKPGAVFAFVRWASNGYGTQVSRIDIIKAVGKGDACQTVPCIRPGGIILLRLNGWSKVQRALTAIDMVEAIGINPADASPDHWRQVHNRLKAGEDPDGYSIERHAAWLARQRIAP
nr:DUF2840 domain-containing protein [uncultured Cohaesibacter sp.]